MKTLTDESGCIDFFVMALAVENAEASNFVALLLQIINEGG
jgi:hypothetical protein